MMKTRAFQTIFIATLFTATCFGQKNTAKFDDGTSIDYEILDKNPDKAPKFAIYTLNGFNFSYFQPNAFYSSIKYGFHRIGGEATIFLTNSEKEKPKKHVIKSEYTGYRTVTNYVIKPEVTIKTYMGLHTGYYYLDYSKKLVEVNSTPIKANEVFLGLGLTRVRFSRIMVNYGKKPQIIKGALQFNLYADVIYFANRTLSINNSTDSTTPDDISKSLGFRAYMEGKNSFSRSANFGITWKLGYQVGPYKLDAGVLGILAGFGFYVGF